jgi:Ser/Thr protein kinase RdoA (MazF antagonist)
LNNRQLLLVEKIKPFYGDFNVSFELVTKGYQNTVFKCLHRDETVYVHVIDSNRRGVQMVEAELVWLRQLFKSGISVPRPKKSNDGNQCETIRLENETYYVMAFSQVHGNQMDVKNPETWNHQLFIKWGDILGSIHPSSSRAKIMRPTFFDPFTPASETIDFLTKRYRTTVGNQEKNSFEPYQ